MVPKLTGEALMRVTMFTREHENVRVDRVAEVAVFHQVVCEEACYVYVDVF